MSTELTTTAPNALVPINPESIIMAALEKGVSVETMERLLAMREQLRKEQAKSAFLAALSAFQESCPIIRKDKDVLNKDGRSVRYSYAPLESIIRQIGPLLASHGFSYSFTTESGNDYVTAHCTASHKDGHSETTSFASKIDPQAFMNLAQKFGSALTFGKRYALCNAFGIVTGEDDDDGQSTTETKVEASARDKLAKIKREADAAKRSAKGPAKIIHQSDETAVTPAFDALNEFLAVVADCTDHEQLTLLARSSDEFKGTIRTAAKRALDDRSQVLGLMWDADVREYFRPSADPALNLDSPDMIPLTDLLSTILEADAATLTACVAEVKHLATEPMREAAKRAIAARRDALNLSWDASTKKYVPNA